jgi:hypothetical protein
MSFYEGGNHHFICNYLRLKDWPKPRNLSLPGNIFFQLIHQKAWPHIKRAI